jgi:hypothetical protein
MDKPSQPLNFTDSQLDMVFRAAQPLAPRDRVAFLEDLANVLREAPHLGDGELYRTIREIQRKHWDAPLAVEASGPRRWGR